jgi:enoyl-CoA hydratase/carnithine racemase
MTTDQSTDATVVLFSMVSQHVALVTLNRPDKRNAVNAAMATAIEQIVIRTEADPDIRCVILTSCDARVFCAGADLSAVASGSGAGMQTKSGGFAGFVYAQRSKPWIAAVEGMSLAGGCEICLACDMIVASTNASFGLPEAKRGLMAMAGGLHRLVAELPRNIALEIIATGEQMDAARAHAYGMVNRLVEPGETLSAAGEIAEAVAKNAPLAVQYSLAAARASTMLTEVQARTVVSELFAKLRETEDYKEGPRAFMEKRLPAWKGR